MNHWGEVLNVNSWTPKQIYSDPVVFDPDTVSMKDIGKGKV